MVGNLNDKVAVSWIPTAKAATMVGVLPAELERRV